MMTESARALVITTSPHRGSIRTAVRSVAMTDLAIVLSLCAALDPFFQPLLTASDLGNWQSAWALMLGLFIPAACFVKRLDVVRTVGRTSGRGWSVAGACLCLTGAALCIVLAAAIGLTVGFGGLNGDYVSPAWSLAASKALAMRSALEVASILFVLAAITGFVAAVMNR